jgi:hypothetical protein
MPTTAVGIGTISLAAATGATSCAATGEMIYNAGDIQTNPVGIFFGPAYCFDAVTANDTGVPCFDGQNHFTDGTLLTGGPNGAYILVFEADYNWYNESTTSGTYPFNFFVQNTLGDNVAVGTSGPDGASSGVPGNGVPILNITLNKQKTVPVPTGYGVAPYLGSSAISCSVYGANASDSVAAAQAAAAGGYGQTIAGSFAGVTGSFVTFGPAYPEGGSWDFNSNDYYVVSGSGSEPNNYDCAVQSFPGVLLPAGVYTNEPSATTASAFADGASNSLLSISLAGDTAIGSDGPCTADTVSGAGYVTSAVQWGTGDYDYYEIESGLVSGGLIEPPGAMATCVGYEQAAAPGRVTNTVTPQTLVSVRGALKTGTVNVTNPTEADCDIEVAMGVQAEIGSRCSLSLVGGSPVDTDAPGPAPSTTMATIDCTCATSSSAESTTETLTIASQSCLLSGTTSYPIVCKN